MKAARTIPPLEQYDKQRFWERVNKDGEDHPYDPSKGKCWVWTGGRTQEGYGYLWIRNYNFRANRISFFLAFGQPEQLIMHSCDRPECVNPNHLEDGTTQQNSHDAKARGRYSVGEAHAATTRIRLRGDDHPARTNPENLARGSSHGRAKLNEESVKVIRLKYESKTHDLRDLSQEYGVSQVSISLAVRRCTWRHVL